jgi:hypothetical protein
MSQSNSQRDKLGRIQAVATIFSLVAVPVIVAKRYGTGNFLTLRMVGESDPVQVEAPESDDPSKCMETKWIVLHRFVLQRVDEDSIGFLLNGKSTSLFINDSVALAPEGRVFHLLGVGHEVTNKDKEHAYTKAKASHPTSIEDYLKKAQAFLVWPQCTMITGSA